MKEEILLYHNRQLEEDKTICEVLFSEICNQLPEAEYKVWHAHPVWFIEENPIVGYSKQKNGIRLMFWSGVSFNEDALKPGTGKFKDASIFYNSLKEINKSDVRRWLEKSKGIQWDYKNVQKNKGKLGRLK